MITQREEPCNDTETIRPEAAGDAHERWPRVRWYADAVRAEMRNANRAPARAETHIDFLSLFLHRALAGTRRSDSRV